MAKKILGLSLIAVLIVIAITQVVKTNIEETQAIENVALGSEVDFLETKEGLAEGEKALDFELTTLDGETVRLSDYKGKKVILNFWATWCPPCRAEMPHMQTYYEEHAKKENVEILAVNLTELDHGVDKVESFVEEYALSFPVPMDVTGEIGKKYQAVTIPTSYMIDTDGRIQHKIVGPMDENMMINFIQEMK
ncbi:peroxiredoxin family protein [Planococcus salinus]|uniref:TlpA family protein disulfide reductase n=1 Tax=Planococcus salinus TaxID=1848460 RepID=A0A3M8P425_9BACL|nr:TlpA disulfide reductase family protein [Planococcus salinus]RNF38151.1 TlpA family protein disulfide reductase [Planococcus salinus]